MALEDLAFSAPLHRKASLIPDVIQRNVEDVDLSALEMFTETLRNNVEFAKHFSCLRYHGAATTPEREYSSIDIVGSTNNSEPQMFLDRVYGEFLPALTITTLEENAEVLPERHSTAYARYRLDQDTGAPVDLQLHKSYQHRQKDWELQQLIRNGPLRRGTFVGRRRGPFDPRV